MRQSSCKQFGKPLFSAEKMGAARNVEADAVRRVRTRVRREALTPERQAGERALIASRVGMGDLKGRMDGACISQCHAPGEAETLCRRAEGRKALAAVACRNQRKGHGGCVTKPVPMGRKA